MNHSDANNNKTLSIEAAWEKLQKQLVTEPVHTQWVRWSKQANEMASNKTHENDLNLAAGEGDTNFLGFTPLEVTNSLGFTPIEVTNSLGLTSQGVANSQRVSNSLGFTSQEVSNSLGLTSLGLTSQEVMNSTASPYILPLTPPQSPSEAPKKVLSLNGLKRNRKWLSGTVAASMLAVTLFTSVGNQALAAILNQFRMEQVTVVQEEDIQKIMNGFFFTEGESNEAINKFGTFSHTTGTIKSGEYTLAEAEKLLNRKLILPKDIDLSENKVYISPSNEITLMLHVDEVNKALQRLGAKKLLPQSIDGKPVKLIFGEGASVSKQVKINGVERHYSFTQMTAPAIEVDPSIPVAEAMDAVVHFPFLPDYLKESLKNSGVLDNGNLPMPVFANGTAEKRTIEGVEVVMTQQKYNSQKSKNTKTVEEINYGLTWVKNGQLYTVNGTSFTDANAAFDFAKELILQ